MNNTLREYRILIPLPDTINQKDTFLKEEWSESEVHEDGTRGQQEPVAYVSHIQTSEDGGLQNRGFIAVNRWQLNREELDILVDCGYLEVYEDKFLN